MFEPESNAAGIDVEAMLMKDMTYNRYYLVCDQAWERNELEIKCQVQLLPN